MRETKSTEANGQPLDAASSASGVSAPAVAPRAADPSTADEDVHPVYPLGGAPDPLAQRFCDALHDLPEKKRAACCAAPPRPSPDGECVRNVSAALRLGGVTLGASDVDACVKAMTASLDGCGWVGALGPSLPRACEGVLHGAFVTGQRCRSSLECAKGLHCAGVGPTDMGTCAEAGGDGAPCGRGVDALATFARDDSSDAEHPACAGLCKAGAAARESPKGPRASPRASA